MANANFNPGKVTTGKGNVQGYIFVGESNATAPTDSTTPLAGFKSLGYISEDGVVNTYDQESENIKDWNGNVVLTVLTSTEDTFKFTLLESLNEDVLKFVYGDDAVSNGVLTVAGAEPVERKLVLEMATVGGKKKRIYIPRAKVSEVGDISYVAGEATAYELTVAALSDGTMMHQEFIEA